MLSSQEVKIFNTENCGAYVNVFLKSYVDNGDVYSTTLVVRLSHYDGSNLFKDGKNHYEFDFRDYSVIDKFLKHLSSVVKTHDLAGGLSDITNYLERFDVNQDPYDTPCYIIDF